jgi:XRE family transcriptional regulator, fatty acid utilization regulator
MAEQKIFAGPRIRRIRHSMKLTQTAMAAELGISPSYLNLIERNQRPLTVQLILKLASVYKVDLEGLRGEEGGTAIALREVFSDPLLSGELPSPQELIEVAEAAPNAANGIVRLYRAYRESVERLSDLSEMLSQTGREPAVTANRLPYELIREIFENRENHFPELEAAAERLAETISGSGTRGMELRERLHKAHGIAVRLLPVSAMPLWRRRFDRHSMRLFLSERLSPFDQQREIATELCRLEMRQEIAERTEDLGLDSEEAKRLARFELIRYAAHALLMPYEDFLATARRESYDIDLLCGRFGVSFEQAANRLTMLSRPTMQGIPFFMLEVDEAGNRIRRAGANGFPQTSFGGRCPKLPVHAAFAQPGRTLIERLAMPDGSEFMALARTLEGPLAGFHERPRRTALLLACDVSYAPETVYGASIEGKSVEPIEIGPACRLCERQGCLSRAEPPLTRPLGLDEMVSGLSAFDFQ